MRRLLLLSLALGLVPACGGDDATSDETSSPSGSGADVNVSLSEYTIDPSAIAVDPGSYTFHVVNDGSTVHALEVEGPNGEVETEHLEPGESADLTVDLQGDGEFEMYCLSPTIASGGWKARSPLAPEAVAARRPTRRRRRTRTRTRAPAATGTSP